MRFKIPAPISGGLLLSYKCNASCTQCMYACSPGCPSDWISEEDLGLMLEQLAGCIMPGYYGPDSVDLVHGLHFSGGEPFLNFDLLCRAVEISTELGIPSTFVETNGFWATDDKSTREKLRHLKSLGLKGIMFSINPFYLEYVPFERTERGIEIGYEVFGQNMIPYQVEYYKRFKKWGIKGTVSFDEYQKYEDRNSFFRNVEFFLSGRAPYKMDQLMPGFFPKYPAELLASQPCSPAFIRPWHNHFDNYGNFMPGYCGGITLGDVRKLDQILVEGIECGEDSVLYYLLKDDFPGLLNYARGVGFKAEPDGYYSKCHLCTEIRRQLRKLGNYPELQPDCFYENLV